METGPFVSGCTKWKVVEISTRGQKRRLGESKPAMMSDSMLVIISTATIRKVYLGYSLEVHTGENGFRRRC